METSYNYMRKVCSFYIYIYSIFCYKKELSSKQYIYSSYNFEINPLEIYLLNHDAKGTEISSFFIY